MSVDEGAQSQAVLPTESPKERKTKVPKTRESAGRKVEKQVERVWERSVRMVKKG